MTRLGIRWQLTLWYSLALSVVLLAFSGALFVTIRTHLLARIDAELTEESNEVAEELELASTESEFRRRFQHHYADDALFGFQVARMDGKILFGSRGPSGVDLPHPASNDDTEFRIFQNIELSRLDRRRMLGRVVQLPDGPLMTYVFAPMEETESQLKSLLTMLFLNGLLAILAAVIVGYFMARRVMAPIHEMTKIAERISSQNLSERIAMGNSGDELGRLSTTLNRTFDRLQRAINEMRRFTADAAHELRTPLAIIRTEVEVALRECELTGQRISEPLQRATDSVHAETLRLSILVDQLLTLSRQETGLQGGDFHRVSLKDVLIDVVESLRILAEEKGIRLILDDHDEQTVLGDELALNQLFFNLIENAVKYTPADGVVRISSQREGSSVRVTVEDTGIGVESKHHEHLFERFYRVDAARSTAGTGLGLAICRSIVEAHHGTIEVESEPGRGTKFTVLLPLFKAVD